MRSLVTGGAGFIGSHIAALLDSEGHDVMVLDDLSRGLESNIPSRASFTKCDVTTPAAAHVIGEFKPDAVFHLAAQMDVRASVADPLFDANSNVLGTVRVAQAAIHAGAKTLVFASTGGAIYGEQDTFPADESHARRPVSPYGTSKMCVENYLESFARADGLRCVSLRYANVYGPRQDPHGEAGVVAIFAGKMLAGQTPTIFGDGKQTRDYVFVADVARANLLACDRLDVSGAVNIGTGVETDVNELAQHLARSTGFRGDFPHAAALPGEQRRSVLDCIHAREVLGWEPEVALADGLKQTAEWFRVH